MSNEELHIDGDFTLNIPHFEADFAENEQPKMQADFKIQTGGSTSFANITGDPYDNEALSDALNQKADTSTVETLSETVENNYTELDGKITDESDARTQADADLQSNIDDVADDLSIETDNRQTADADLQDNIDTVDGKIDTHIADKSNPHEVTKAQIGLENVDNTSDLNKPISTATQTALNDKQNTINDLATIRTNASNGQSAYNTIQNYGDIVTYDASSFATSIQGQKADTALQPNDNISELNNDAGYITSASLPAVNNSTITFQKNNVTVGDINLNQPNNETINFNIPTIASDVNALPDTTTINDLTTTAQQNAIDSGANTSNIGQIATNTSNISSLSTTVTNNYNTLDGRITSEVSALNTTIGTETTNRQNADNNLQSQIDAIVASSDVFDIVGTYAELQAYDISIVPVNDIIKVLVDSTHSNAATYYRCVETGGVKSWSYIGSEGAYYTKSESDSLFVDKTTTVNGKALSNNITLTASDVGALPDNTVIPTVNNGTLTIQQNGTDVQTFGANQSSNVTANITFPTDTSDLTNGAGFITNSALSSYATTTDLTNGLATKQDTISDLSTIRSNATNGQSAYTTIGGYGDIVTYNASNFVQKNGNSSTQTISLTSGTGTTALGIKSMATSSYISFSGSSGWLGSFGVTSNKRPAFYNGTGYTLAYTSEIPTNTSDLINDSGFITGIGSNDVITALGYTPASNSAFTGADGTNAGSSGLVPAPSATDNDKYLKGDGTWASVSSGSSTDVQINGTSITSGGVANILTQTAYNASSNKIATMSDLPDSEIFVAEYNVTSYADVLAAYNVGKTIVCYDNTHINSSYDVIAYLTYYDDSSDIFYFTCGIDYADNTYNAYILDTSSWTNVGGAIPSTSGFANTDLSNLTATGEAHFQEPLVSGTNIKTVNNTSLLGSGDISVGSYSAGTGLSLSGTTFNHSNSVTAGTIGTSSATSGSTISVPYANYDAQGHITSKGTHTHTVTGFLTSSSSEVASSRFDGQWVSKHSTLADTVSMGNATSKTYSLASYLPDATYNYEVMFSGLVITAASSGKFLKMILDSSVVSNVWVCDARTRTSSAMEATGSCIIPISKNSQQIVMKSEASSNSSGTMSLAAVAYRRIGTNT